MIPADIAAQVEALSPPDQLHLAADLLEKRKADLAYAIAKRVVNELGIALAIKRIEAERRRE